MRIANHAPLFYGRNLVRRSFQQAQVKGLRLTFNLNGSIPHLQLAQQMRGRSNLGSRVFQTQQNTRVPHRTNINTYGVLIAMRYCLPGSAVQCNPTQPASTNDP